jgi:hypothetical protein
VKSTPAAHFININVASAVSVYKAGLWLYMSSIASQLGGYLFWFVAAASVSVAMLGEVAYLATLASIATALLTLGVPTAVMRLWPATGDRKYAEGALAFALVEAGVGASGGVWPHVGVLHGLFPDDLQHEACVLRHRRRPDG